KHVTQALLTLLLKSNSPRIVNVSSKLGQLENVQDENARKILSDVDGLTEEVVDEVVKEYLKDVKDEELLKKKGWSSNVSGYIVSKAALNAYTRILAKKYPSLCANAVSPGFVATDMTFFKGTSTAEEGAKGPVRLALMPEGGPTGDKTHDASTGPRVAVVTGGNKGIGLEICRQLASNGITVVLAARDEGRGLEAVTKLKDTGLTNVVFHQLDIKNPTSIARFTKFVESQFQKLDILVNNAAENGIIVKYDEFRAFKDGAGYTNYYGTKALTEALLPLLQLSNSPRIVNVSSNYGELHWIRNEMVKAELMARKFTNILLNCVHPGYVITDITSHTGHLTPEEGAKAPVMVALLPNDGPSGVNNAGVSSTIVDEESFWSIDLPSEVKDEKAKQVKKTITQTFEGAQKCLETNYYGAKHVTQALLTLLFKSNSPRIVNVSSKLGQLENVQDENARKILSDVDGLTEEVVDEVVKEYLKDVKDEFNVSGYIVSKASFNAYTRILAKKYPSLCANAVSPGFVATDMTFFKGTSTAEEGAR
ncbi:hypothetical protein M8C21_030439, partial [Ambrosia artemisiifolia]